jgi:exopolyphosphatase/guanosine-5'-triphosphate,3'-diphosphate pyrophosphatase
MLAATVSTTPLYAVIDLGSNSFHMLITRLVAGSVQTVDKVKRKVRLASGLNEQNELSEEAMARGLQCLRFFAERLQDIPPENVQIVATATLRIAVNSDVFLQQAHAILGRSINLLSGIEEAKNIYFGVAHTSCCSKQRLVLDIGGASTEIIVGDGFEVKQVKSLNIGCVTFNHLYFTDALLNDVNFERAIFAAKSQLMPLLADYQAIGWQSVLGGSGTMQALAEILSYNQQPTIITLPFLKQVQHLLIACKHLEKIEIAGLDNDRKPVFASGVAILVALFESFTIQELKLSNGALREGLLYELMPNMQNRNIRHNTINSLNERFSVDIKQAKRVSKSAVILFEQLGHILINSETSNNSHIIDLLKIACQWHELGLTIGFKNYREHGAYILQHADLAGFEQGERCLLKMLVKLHIGDIDDEQVTTQVLADAQTIKYLLVAIRLAVIFSHRRQDDIMADYHLRLDDKHDSILQPIQNIILSLPQAWLSKSPLMVDELHKESDELQALGFTLVIEAT